MAAAALCAALTGCYDAGKEHAPTQPAVEEQPVTAQTEEQTAAKRLLDDITLEQKVGQLFFIRPDSLDFTLSAEQVNDDYDFGITEMTDAMGSALAGYPAGGVVIFGKNIEDAEALAALIDGLAEASEIPLVFAVDEEGGSVARIAGSGAFEVTEYESMAAVGASGDPEEARAAGREIGGYLRRLGFTLDFAPVADVNTNPDNTVIGNRAFGSDPNAAAQMVSAAVEGFHEAGIACCLKHYPGHGDTNADTHDGYAETEKSWDELQSCELVPFRAGIKAGADLVMAAHISVPSLTGDETPASLSYELITEKLRGELGFRGVVVTDSLAMGAVTKNYTPAAAAVAALKAGADIILMPEDYRPAFEGVLAAVRSGELNEQRIDESALRILELKKKYGLI